MAVDAIRRVVASLSCHPSRGSGGCCGCKEENEILTAALRERLEQEGGDYAAMKLMAPPRDAAGALPKTQADSMGTAAFDSASATAGRAPLTALEVPNEFDNVRLPELMSSVNSDPSDEGRRLALKVCLRSFTRTMLRGVCMSVLLDDGRTLLTDASLDSDLTHLVLFVPNLQHPVALSCIEGVCSPCKVMTNEALACNRTLLDERCTTLIIQGGHFVTLVFDASRTREYFEVCLKVLILARERALGSPSEPRCVRESRDAGAVDTISTTTPISMPPLERVADSPPNAFHDQGSIENIGLDATRRERQSREAN
mmetsp:Transcript_87541/g.245911  ORF Transcript_87541/g.245911 Transcript_87541/m.245911 type:complete len:313 (-) Transcript_87541:101-1039(-)